jgi:hypothetical protein
MARPAHPTQVALTARGDLILHTLAYTCICLGKLVPASGGHSPCPSRVVRNGDGAACISVCEDILAKKAMWRLVQGE